MNKTAALFLVDGMRPDGLQQARTPVMDRLIASGAHTLAARTVMPSVSLPAIMSLFLGVSPERHGITTNVYAPPARPVPGLLDVIHQAGGRTASFYNWEELRDLGRPGALNASFFLANDHVPDGQGDTELADLAVAWLSRNSVNFVFVYLGHTDAAGHNHGGWMSETYLHAIANADGCIGRIVETLPAESLIVVTADHGGHARTHGTDSSEDMTIPIIMRGPGVSSASVIQNHALITDIAPTVANWLGLQAPVEWEGTVLLAGH